MEIKPFKRSVHNTDCDELNYTDSEIYGSDSRRTQGKVKMGKMPEIQPLVGSKSVENHGELQVENDRELSVTDSEIYKQGRKYRHKKRTKVFEMQPLVSEQKRFKDNRLQTKSDNEFNYVSSELNRGKHKDMRNDKVILAGGKMTSNPRSKIFTVVMLFVKEKLIFYKFYFGSS